MTLIELLVASSLLMVLMALAFSTLLAVRDGSARTRTQHDLNEEGRNALNRIAREIRQADAISFAVNPDGPAFDANDLVAMSLRADFNGDGCAGNRDTANPTGPGSCPGTDNVNNPESLTYCFDPNGSATERTYLWLIPTELTAAPPNCKITGALPILAGNVGGFAIQYRSNEYRYDVEAPAGVTTWRELDQAAPPVGDASGPDGDINTSAIHGVNAVVITLDMAKDGLSQSYTTQVDVRNNG